MSLLDITTTIKFVKDRVEATTSAQESIATKWVWPLKTVAQWQADLNELDGSRDGNQPGTLPSLAHNAIAAHQFQAKQANDLANRYELIHIKTVQAVGVMRGRAMADRSHAAVVDELSARGDSNIAIEDEGAELLAAWKLEFGENFTPAPGNTYDGLRELFEGKTDAQGNVVTPSLRQLKDAMKTAAAATRKAEGVLNLLFTRLEDECVQWYAEAVQVFAEGTPEGDMIRTTVPTSDQYSPGHPKPANPAPK